MKRRICLGAAGACLWPGMTAHAQAALPDLRRIAFLCGATQAQWAPFVAAFHEGVAGAGFEEGRQVHTEYRWADGRYERLPALADELVSGDPAVLVATGGSAAVRAAKRHAARIPVVFTLGIDPVALGLVDSLARPGGNMTGALLFATALMSKRLELLHQLLPRAKRFAVLVNAESAGEKAYVNESLSAARSVGVQLDVLRVGSPAEIEPAVTAAVKRGAAALLVTPEPLFDTHRQAIVDRMAQLALPAVYGFREYVVQGGLMSYGPSLAGGYRQAGDYAGRILRGARPAELPIVQPTSFELVLNRAAARGLGLEWPRASSLRADEVIE